MILTKFEEALQSYSSYVDSGPIKQVSESIAIVPFWKPEFCKILIEYANAVGSFSPLDVDLTEYGAAPGQECRISTISEELYHLYRKHILDWVAPALIYFYRCEALFNRDFNVFRDPFIVKYTMDTQTSMSEHHDHSLLSLSINLNDGYEGCAVTFPRQNWNNFKVPVGHATIFPGQLTHPHYTSDLVSGERYGLTGWIRGPDLRNVSP